MFAQTLSDIAYFEILLPLALILLCTKLFSLIGKNSDFRKWLVCS